MTDRYVKIHQALAMGPTPGPWVQDGDGVTADDYDVAVAMCCPSDAEAAFIAACDPDTIRALLEERDALQEQLAEAEHTVSAQTAEIEKLQGEVEQLTAALEAAREGGWQPIETAPKDGTRVLLWFGWHDLPVVGDFRYGRWWSVHSLGGNLSHTNGMDWEEEEEVMKPAYWRPLPPPPDLESAWEERAALAKENRA